MRGWVLLLLLLAGPVQAVPLSYSRVVSRSLERNLRLLSQEADVPVAQADLEIARAQRNPTLTDRFFYLNTDRHLLHNDLPNTRYLGLAAGETLSQSSLYTLGQNMLLNRTTLDIPVYTGGRLESAIHLRAALVEVAKLGVERARQSVVFETKQQYLATLLTVDNVEVAHQVVRQAQEILGYARSSLQAGVGTKLDVLQAQVAVASAQDAVVRAEGSAAKAKTDMAALVDLPLLTEFEFQDNLEVVEEPIASRDLKDLVHRGLGQRPELRQLRERLMANKESENIAISGSLPRLEVLLHNDLSGSPNRLGEGENISALLTIPIYDSGLTQALVKEVNLGALRLSNEEEQQVENIIVEVRRALLDVEESDARLQTARAAQVKASEALRISTLRYQVGAGTSLELVTAQAALANAEFGLAEARYRQVVTRARLNFALGNSLGGKP